MRWRTVNCIFLACLVTAIATDTTNNRPKRDLQFWKNLIAAKLGLIPPKPVIKVENVKVLPIPPRYEQIMVRDVPKITIMETPVPQRLVPVDPTLAVLQSYLGTRSPDQTIIALERVKNLLASGVLSARQDMVELVPQREQIYVQPQIIHQRVDIPEPRPIVPIYQNVMMPMPTPVMQPIFQHLSVLPPPAPISVPVTPKVVVPQIRPVPPPVVPLPVPPPPVIALPGVPTKYSYRQVNSDGSLTSYLSLGNQDVIVTETGRPLPPPPPYIIDRFQKIIFGMPLGVARVPPSPLPPLVPLQRLPLPPPLAPLPPLLPPPRTFAPVPRPFVDILMPPKVFIESEFPAITGPANVEVKINSNKKQHQDLKDKKQPSGAIVDIPTAPLVIPPPPVVVSRSNPNEPSGPSVFEPQVQFEQISKLPPPPPQILERMDEVTGKKSNGRGYSMKISNGVGTYENVDGSKIYYSRLEPGTPDEPSFPEPLSTHGPEIPRKPYNIMVDSEEDNSVYNNEVGENSNKGSTSSQLDIQPIKKFPKLPMPIAGENEKSPISLFPFETPLKRISDIKLDANIQSGSGGFSYTQVKHDGTLNKYTGEGHSVGPAIAAEYKPASGAVTSGERHFVGPAIAADYKPAPVAVSTGEAHFVRPAVVAEYKPTPVAVSFEHTKSGSDGFSYTQISHDGSRNSFTGEGQDSRPAVLIEPFRPAVSLPVIVDERFEHTKSASGRFSYTQISHDGSRKSFTGEGQGSRPAVLIEPFRPAVSLPVIVDERFKPTPSMPPYAPVAVNVDRTVKIPVRPAVILKPIEPIPPLAATLKDCDKIPKGFSYSQSNGGNIVTVTGNKVTRPVLVEKIEPVPVTPPHIVKVVQPSPAPVLVKVDEQKPPGTVIVPRPIVSKYVYKQVSHRNPGPMTIVPVGHLPILEPKLEVLKGDVEVKVNRHEHIRPDGTRYPCTEVHLVPPVEPILPVNVIPIHPPPQPEEVSKVPDGFVFIPPVNALPPLPIMNRFGEDQLNMSNTEVTNAPATDAPTTTEGASSKAPTTEEQQSLSLNPIVVAPVETKYSFTQTHSDGSSTNVKGDNTVSVHINQSLDKPRGDIPDALA